MVKLTKALIELQRTFLEAAFHITLLNEGAVAVFGVVAGERQVAQSMQPRFLDALPFRAQLSLPACGEILVLWQDVLNRVFIHCTRSLRP